jgi:hypothetical protein
LNEDWYAIHRRIFANVEPEPTPVLLRGALAIGTGHDFLATAFTDAQRRDSQGRPIAHYLAWLGKAAEEAPGLSYGPGLIAALGPALEAVFKLSPETLKRDETKPLDTLIRRRFLAALPARQLTVPCQSGHAPRWLGTIAV